jgi:hypothetical protein
MAYLGNNPDAYQYTVEEDPDNAYTVTGGVITFSEAPSVGTNNILVLRREGTTFTRTQIDTGDILPNAVTTAALSTTGVTAGNYGGASNVTTITVDSKGRISYAANVAIETGFNPFLLSGM